LRASSRHLLALLLGLGMGVACARAPAPAVLSHEAYVWQRAWSAPLAEAVEHAPGELGALRVLAREHTGAARVPVSPGVDVGALVRSGREVVAVLRVDGTAPLTGLSLDAVAGLARAWQARGARVVGVEVDHDCATAALGAYADWLSGERGRLQGLRLSITALPTWTSSPALPRLLAQVDDVVVQVHAVQAPTLFAPGQARAFLEAWSAATARPFRVALPTYRVRLRDGTPLHAEPREVAAFLAGLRERPVRGLTGVVWFRLGHAEDAESWGAATLSAVLRGAPLAPHLQVRLVEAGGGARDIVLENAGTLDAEGPAALHLTGALDVLDGVRGYTAQGATLSTRSPPRIRAGERVVVGFARGQELSIALP
jgi:hypothetical protein